MPKILIVEDELIAAEYLKEVLTTNGFEVMGVIDNGKEAMRTIPSLKPDIVLMDIMLKDNISGSEVALYLKQHAPKTAIIFLTAYADSEMVEYAVESNSYGYLMKPYNEKEIINTLKVIYTRLKECAQNNNKFTHQITLEENLIYNLEVKKLFHHNTELHIGEDALKLLDLLCNQPNTLVSNEQISLHIWKDIINPVTLRTNIHRIKEQINFDVIHNVNSLGYMIKTL